MFSLWNFISAAAFLTAAEQTVDFDYFLKGINTPAWHWLFRIVFMLGLIVVVAVYLYYRKGLDENSPDDSNKP